MKKKRQNKDQKQLKYKGRQVTAEFKALELKCNQRVNKYHVGKIMEDLEVAPPPKPKPRFKIGMLVTGMGVDIQRVISINDDGISGKFKILSDPTNMYEVGEIEEHPFALYYRITEISFTRLYANASRCGWFIDVDSLEND